MLALVLAAIVVQSAAFRILVLHPLHSGSHEVQLRELSGALLKHHHQITYVKFKNFVQLPPLQHPNFTLLTLAVDNADGSIPFITAEREGRFMLPLDIMWKDGLDPFGLPMDAFRTITPHCDALLGDTRLIQELREKHLDVAVVDLFTNECGLALAHHLGVPAVAYWALPLSGGEAALSSGLSSYPGVSPSFMSQLTDTMSFLQRAKNLFFWLMNRVVMQFQMFITDRAIQRHLPGTPSSAALLSNLSGVLENSDFTLDYPRELPPNIVNVGCMQCREPRPLPQELEDFMAGAGPSGVVLFSMGATFDASVAPPRLLRRLLNAFARLPERVVMKYGGAASLPRELVPPNVRAERWLPQQDVLGHAQTRAFFTHCGLHGALEGAWHGVPAVALPVFGDQADVAEMLRARGVAVRLDKDASEARILSALRTVLDDPRYARNARELRTRIRDQVATPMQRALWLVEHVGRTRGAAHLKLASRDLGLVHKLCLDVWLALLLLLTLLYRWRHVPGRSSAALRRRAAITLRRWLHGNAKSH